MGRGSRVWPFKKSVPFVRGKSKIILILVFFLVLEKNVLSLCWLFPFCAGKLKSALTNSGKSCATSTPTIIRGRSFVIETVENFHKHSVYFECLNQRLSVEVHLK